MQLRFVAGGAYSYVGRMCKIATCACARWDLSAQSCELDITMLALDRTAVLPNTQLMKWNDMLTADANALRTHYASVRELAYNNGRMAQGCSPFGKTLRKLASQMGYLQTQISMCENAAKKRGMARV